MKLEGAKINFLGDSITEGYGVSNPEKLVWHQLIKRDYGLKQANNYGASGTRIARRTVPFLGTPVYDITFELRAEIMARDVDAVVVFGGVNDFGHGDAHFGNVNSDSEDIYTFSFREQMRKVFEMDPVTFDEDNANAYLHYCPLVTAWQKMGFSDEDIALLCDITMDGDRGVAEACGFNLHLGCTIGSGCSDKCNIHFWRNELKE